MDPREAVPRRALLNATVRRRGIYILPNLFTTGGLFCGFFAIVQGMNWKFDVAAIAIFVAMILDSLDGRVARMTHTQSAFGAEYDSLSDMVAFGAAPALVMYEWALRGLGKLGWVAAFVYCAGAALRLARFNVQLDVADKRYFTGLPSPSAAAIMAGLIWVLNDHGIRGTDQLFGVIDVRWLAFAITLFAGITMVSNVKYHSFKDFNVRRSVPFWAVLVVLAAFAVLAIDQPRVLWGVFLIYALSGYVLWGRDWWRRRKQKGQR